MPWRDAVPEWLADYRRSWLPSDVAAGAATWAVLVPLSLSIAAIAGVDPVVGLYTFPLALVGYAIFGGQRALVVGPDAAVAILSGGVVASIATGRDEFLALTIALAVTVGFLYVLFYFFRMGWIADLVPDPVLKGFTEGIIWLTLLKQSVTLLGLAPDEHPSGLWGLLVYLRHALSETHVPTAAAGAISIVTLVLFRRVVPRWPGPLIVLAGAIVLSGVLGLSDAGVPVLGVVEGGLPRFALPTRLDSDQIVILLSGALAIVLLGYTKALPPLKRAADYSGDSLDPNRELLALGAANIGAAMGGGHALSASLTATSISIAAGGKTQAGNLFAGLLTVLTILFLLPLLQNLPLSSLAAIIMVALGGVSNLAYFHGIWQISRYEFLIAAAAFAGVLAFGVLPGVLIGVVLALFKLAYAIHEPVTATVGRTPSGGFVDIDEHPEAAEIPGMVILHQYGPLVFLNARILAEAIRKATGAGRNIQVVVLDATASSGIDSSAADKMVTVRDELAKAGIELWVVNPRQKGWRIVESLLRVKKVAPPRVFNTIPDAISAFETSSGPNPVEQA
jgi:MFS superfamily sulfate permease-like transporter